MRRTVHAHGFRARNQAPPSRSRTVGSHYRNCMTQETAAAGRDDSVTQKPAFDAIRPRVRAPLVRHRTPRPRLHRRLARSRRGPGRARSRAPAPADRPRSSRRRAISWHGSRRWTRPRARKGYLTKQVEAMLANARRARRGGDPVPRRGTAPLRHRAASDAGRGLRRGDRRSRHPPARRRPDRRAHDRLAAELRDPARDRATPGRRHPARAARADPGVSSIFPQDESIEIRMVQDQPWSGYNWYLGNGRSRVDLNTDLPIYAYRLTDLLAHEGYPGHHTEHALKERLYTEQGLGEHALQLINTPGVRDLGGDRHRRGEDAVRSTRSWSAFGASASTRLPGSPAIPSAKSPSAPRSESCARFRATRRCLLHEEGRDPEEVVAYLQRYALSTEAEARQRLRFIADPLWRAYIFTYHVGYELISALAGPGARRAPRADSERSSPSRSTPRRLPPGRHRAPVHFLLDRGQACEAWQELVQTRDENSRRDGAWRIGHGEGTTHRRIRGWRGAGRRHRGDIRSHERAAPWRANTR